MSTRKNESVYSKLQKMKRVEILIKLTIDKFIKINKEK